MTFSERLGLRQPKSVLQVSSMDDDLRNGLWNVLHLTYWQLVSSPWSRDALDRVVISTWANFYKKPVDQQPRDAIAAIRKDFFEWPWSTVYDFVEFMAGDKEDWDRTRTFIQLCNTVLERELAGYRFVEDQLIPIGTEFELAAIEQARRDTMPYANVSEHLRQAASLLADRERPDFRNSIKESVLAVEATCQVLTGKRDTLGQCLNELERNVTLHPALRSAFSKLYGWTSDAEGIRHALLEAPNLTVDDARFMLVACSGFASYLLAKSAQSG